MMLGASLSIVVAAAALALVRRRYARVMETRIDARRPFDPVGILRGADAIDLPGDQRAILLLHGFGDTPHSLRYVAEVLHRRGWGIHAPRLPGHGGRLVEFARSDARQWVDAASAELSRLEQRYETVVLAGLSMGGAIATILTAERARDVPLVLLAPYLTMPRLPRWIAATYPVSGVLSLPYLDSRTSRSILDPSARAESIGYGVTTPRLLRELSRVVHAARAAAEKVTSPLLVIHSSSDHRIPRALAERSFARFMSGDKTLEWVDRSGHVLTVDYERDRVADIIGAWLDARIPAGGDSRTPLQNPTPSGEMRPR